MDFGEALKALKEGKKITRKGWNGQGMYLYLTPGHKLSSQEWTAKDPAHEMTDHERLTGAKLSIDPACRSGNSGMPD